MKQTYSGGCQCGKVRYEASFELGEVIVLQLLALRAARLAAGVHAEGAISSCSPAKAR